MTTGGPRQSTWHPTLASLASSMPTGTYKPRASDKTWQGYSITEGPGLLELKSRNQDPRVNSGKLTKLQFLHW